MTQTDFLKNYKKDIDILGDFKNQYGEEYIVFQIRLPSLSHLYYIAGDETDWEMLILGEDYKFAYTSFIFSEEESKEIKKIINE